MVETENKDLVPLNAQLLPAELLGLTEEDAGKGVSSRLEDQLMPILNVLQSGSPVVDKHRPEYVEGASPGDFCLRNALNPIRDGVTGIEVVPCAMVRSYLEWRPNRGGYAGRHPEPPPDAETTTVSEGGREKELLVRANGHILEDTREFFLLTDSGPYVLGCSGTKHTFARKWQTYFSQFKHPKTGATLPSFARRYQLTTVPTSNAMGRWFGLKFVDLGYVDAETYAVARRVNDIVEQGRARIETPHEPGSATD